MKVYDLATQDVPQGKNPSMVFSFGGPLERKKSDTAEQLISKVARTSVDEGYRVAYSEWVKAAEDYGAILMDWELVSPLAIGLGNKGSFETGFTFLRPYGVPYVPGSSLKGLVRQVAAEQWGLLELLRNANYRPDMTLLDLKKSLGKGQLTDELKLWYDAFGSPDGSAAVDFWGLWPNSSDLSFVEGDVLTPHAVGYYDRTKAGSNIPAPAGKDDPVPVHYLTVKTGIKMTSAWVCGTDWLKEEVVRLIKVGLTEHGIGAKTTADLGRFKQI